MEVGPPPSIKFLAGTIKQTRPIAPTSTRAMIDNPRTSFVLMVVAIVISAIAIAFVLTSFAHGMVG